MSGTAIISPCGCYRYLLTRGPLDQPYALFVMLNPSTADASRDDPTIRRCRGFAKDLGYVAFRVVNLFAWRSTSPDAMKRQTADKDIVGPDNDHHIAEQTKGAAIVICAWGGHGSFAARDKAVKHLIRSVGAIPHYLRRSAATGQPEHPLYLPADLRPKPLEAWQ